jgi:protoheme IX farnesyltransferase
VNRLGAGVRRYYIVTKPGIVQGNVMVAAAAFLFGEKGHISQPGLIVILAGVSLVIDGACVYNNYLDRPLDKVMERTRKRPSVTGEISVRNAMIYATLLVVSGSLVLAWLTNLLTVILGLIGVFFYVIVYGYAKRHTPHGTLVGSISGSIPPVAGYAAATGRLDVTALLLFIIMAIWQMPHFYAIAIFRRKDYAAAGLPVWSVARGIPSTIRQMRFYVILFLIAAPLLTIWGTASYSYGVAMLLISLWWVIKAFRVTDKNQSKRWAGAIFGQSLVILMLFSALLAVDFLLP